MPAAPSRNLSKRAHFVPTRWLRGGVKLLCSVLQCAAAACRAQGGPPVAIRARVPAANTGARLGENMQRH